MNLFSWNGITTGTPADCSQAYYLIEGIKVQNLLADKGYDTNDIIEHAQKLGMEVIIPPKKNRKTEELMTKTFIEGVLKP